MWDDLMEVADDASGEASQEKAEEEVWAELVRDDYMGSPGPAGVRWGKGGGIA